MAEVLSFLPSPQKGAKKARTTRMAPARLSASAALSVARRVLLLDGCGFRIACTHGWVECNFQALHPFLLIPCPSDGTNPAFHAAPEWVRCLVAFYAGEGLGGRGINQWMADFQLLLAGKQEANLFRPNKCPQYRTFRGEKHELAGMGSYCRLRQPFVKKIRAD